MTKEQLYLLEQAVERLNAAKILLNSGYTKDAASRAYYSIFYVAEAFLQGKGKSFSSHSAVISVFGRDFANVGIVPIEFHRMLLDAERLRHKADYGRHSTVSIEEAQRQIGRAEQFLELGNRLIATPHYRQQYEQYVEQVNAVFGNLPQSELDQKVAVSALESHAESEVKFILRQSKKTQMEGEEYVQQTLALAIAQVQNRSQTKSQEERKRNTSPEQDLES